MFFQSFSFNALNDSKGLEILDFQYGNSRQSGTYAPKERVAPGQIFGEGGTGGMMPRGDFLYVKWRMKASGKIYEDKVDLRTRLPEDMTNYGIHFAIKESQLFVYLIPPPGNWIGVLLNRPLSDSDAAYINKLQIYPDHGVWQ